MMRIFVTHSGSRTGQTKASVMRSTLLGRRTRNRQKEEDEPGHTHDCANRGGHDAEDPGCPRKGPIARRQLGPFEAAGGGPAHEVGDGPADQAGNAERDPKDQSDDGHLQRDEGAVVERLRRAVLGRRVCRRRVVRRDRRRRLDRAKDAHFRSDRAITTRWIWFVPSYIWVILASRIIRSTG